MKKAFVLVVLFVLPLVAYLFFASGVNNFGKLPVLGSSLDDLEVFDTDVRLEGHITILGFLGNRAELRKANAFNLNQKIYKRFYEFNDFQMVMLVPYGKETIVEAIKKELNQLTDASRWKFVFAKEEDIRQYYNTLNIPLALEDDYGSSYVFIIDKAKKLRGRDDDEDDGIKYGFDATSVAELNNKMVDDVKIILAEYRLALKKNNATRNK